jgi:hypothetical protein
MGMRSFHPLHKKIFTKCTHTLGIFRDNCETSLSASRSPDFDSEIKAYFTECPQMLKALLSTRKTVLAHIAARYLVWI